VYNSPARRSARTSASTLTGGPGTIKPVNIFDTLFAKIIPPGRTTVYSPLTAVPGDALPGAYSEQADIADRNDPADRAGQYGSFDVTGRKLLSVPYLTQPAPAGRAVRLMVRPAWP